MSLSDLLNLDLASAKEGLAKKEFSALELTEAYLAQMENHRALNAYITETPEIARAQAKAADKAIAEGKMKLMTGIPIGMKDLFCTDNVLTTAGSKILENFTPAYESTVSQNLKDHGAILLGKLNLDEFAMGSANLTSHYGPVINPWSSKDKKLVPGGSSGGSSAAVAAGLALAATGTDTGGSIRQPASFCGIVGLKPSYGRVSRWGTIAFASSLDQAGPMTRSVRDAAIMLKAMAGYDVKDSTCAQKEVPNFEKAFTKDIKGLRIGIPKEYHRDGMDPEIEVLWEKGKKWLAEQGAELVDVSLPHSSYALPAYYIIAPAEASSNLARYDGVRYGFRAEGVSSLDELYAKTRSEGFGHEVQRRILIGTYVLSAGYYDAYYKKAQRVRRKIMDDFTQAYEKCDLLLTPTTPSAAFGLEDKMRDPVQMYLNDIFTVPASLAGLPAISVPAGLNKDGLPLGLQLIGRSFDEMTLLNVAERLEHAAGFTVKPVDRASKGAGA